MSRGSNLGLLTRGFARYWVGWAGPKFSYAKRLPRKDR